MHPSRVTAIIVVEVRDAGLVVVVVRAGDWFRVGKKQSTFRAAIDILLEGLLEAWNLGRGSG